MKRVFKLAGILSVMCWCISFVSFAQDGRRELMPSFHGNPDGFLLKQAELTFELIDATLKNNPPETGESPVRKLALHTLDGLLHETKYDHSEPLQAFMSARIEAALHDLSTPVDEGLKIYKLYNHSFVVRSKTVTIAFDLYRGAGLIRDSLMQAIVDQCDIMFVTHLHRDHADPEVAEMFIRAHKPVWAPPNLWEDNPSINHIRSEKMLSAEARLNGGTIHVSVLPGHQGDLINNVYCVTTPEGLSVVHTGDQHQGKDMEWIAKVKDEIGDLDVLLVNCWTLKMNEVVDSFDPILVVPGHENEMGHNIDQREPYWLSYWKMSQINKPYVLMGWGEFYTYKR